MDVIRRASCAPPSGKGDPALLRPLAAHRRQLLRPLYHPHALSLLAPLPQPVPRQLLDQRAPAVLPRRPQLLAAPRRHLLVAPRRSDHQQLGAPSLQVGAALADVPPPQLLAAALRLPVVVGFHGLLHGGGDSGPIDGGPGDGRREEEDGGQGEQLSSEDCCHGAEGDREEEARGLHACKLSSCACSGSWHARQLPDDLGHRDLRNRVALFDGIEEGGIRASTHTPGELMSMRMTELLTVCKIESIYSREAMTWMHQGEFSLELWIDSRRCLRPNEAGEWLPSWLVL
ncbi:hypothetical protein Taro_055907 [Colocasia esculenta]|uniref:Uncharacterized protein n=1 Tax=Colocasia esculenta TaxID=4460 RepID=A0A843XSK0_COLES|nr:hypothetical protein [Colocasia esculenta]